MFAARFLREWRGIINFAARRLGNDETYGQDFWRGLDGGGEFLGFFVRVCEELGVKRMVNPPYNPKCNAHIESFNGGFRRECLNGLPRASTGETVRAAVASYTRFYNAKRCHSALGGESPIMA